MTPSYADLVAQLATLTDKNRVLEARIEMADMRFKSAVESKNGEIHDLRVALNAEVSAARMHKFELGQERVLRTRAETMAAIGAQFTEEELRTLIGLVHPDRHGGKESAVRMTQKINQLRGKR